MDNILLALYAFVTFTVMLLPSLELLGGASSGRGAACLVDGALALVLAATILWRRLRWEPVGGWLVDERVETREMRVVSTTYYWRWTLGGREYEASDLIPALLCAPIIVAYESFYGVCDKFRPVLGIEKARKNEAVSVKKPFSAISARRVIELKIENFRAVYRFVESSLAGNKPKISCRFEARKHPARNSHLTFLS